MVKFDNSEQQLETCMTIFNPLDINIDINNDAKVDKQMSKAPNTPSEKIWDSAIDDTFYTEKTTEIIVSLECPKFAEDPKNIEVIFDVYAVDSTTILNSKVDFSYRIPIEAKQIESLGAGGDTLLKSITRDNLVTVYSKVNSYLQNKIQSEFHYDMTQKSLKNTISKELGTVKLYALAYIVIDNKIKKGDEEVTIKSTRPNIAMHKYKLDEQAKTNYDDFMLETVKNNIDKELKDKVYFFKAFKEIKGLKVEDILKGNSVNSKPVPRQEDKFFVKIG